eukprot:11637414-Alexandrium_andersonii.AAC.1
MLFKNIPGLGVLGFVPDLMHVLHLGCYQWALGSVLKYLVYHHMPGSPAENLGTVWKLIQEAYQALD